MKLHYYGTIAPPKLHYEKGYNGHGFGSLFACLFKSLAKPAVKGIAKAVKVAGRKALRVAARKAVPLAKKAVKKAAIIHIIVT